MHKKFQYGEIQVIEFRAVTEEMLLLMCKEAFGERKEFLMKAQNWMQTDNIVYEILCLWERERIIYKKVIAKGVCFY